MRNLNAKERRLLRNMIKRLSRMVSNASIETRQTNGLELAMLLIEDCWRRDRLGGIVDEITSFQWMMKAKEAEVRGELKTAKECTQHLKDRVSWINSMVEHDQPDPFNEVLGVE